MINHEDVIAAIRTQLSEGQIVDIDQSLADAGIDSLDFVEIVMHLEDQFSVELDVDQISDKMSVLQFAKWVASSVDRAGGETGNRVVPETSV